MNKQNCYDNYPFWIVAISNAVSLFIYLLE